MKKKVQYWLIGTGAVYIWLIAMMVFLSPRSDLLNAATADETLTTYANVAITPATGTFKQFIAIKVYKHPTYGLQSKMSYADNTPTVWSVFSRKTQFMTDSTGKKTGFQVDGTVNNVLLFTAKIYAADKKVWVKTWDPYGKVATKYYTFYANLDPALPASVRDIFVITMP